MKVSGIEWWLLPIGQVGSKIKKEATKNKTMKKQIYKKFHCNQCHREFKYKIDLANSLVSICHYPDCPNYALLQMPLEQMPKEKEKKGGGHL